MPSSNKTSASHPKPQIDWRWVGFVVIETLVNLGLLRFRWSSPTLTTIPWAFAEVVRFFSSLFKAFQLLMPIKRAPLRLDDLLHDEQEYPTVDIMIPCYNEPLHVSSGPVGVVVRGGGGGGGGAAAAFETMMSKCCKDTVG